MLETERSIVTEIYCRKHQLTPLATLETFLSETLLLHVISRPNTQGTAKKEQQKTNVFPQRLKWKER